MGIEVARIDDRLLHGQVVTTWIREYSLEQCIVVSDEIAANELQRQLLELAAPKGMRVAFYGPERFAEIAANNPIKRRSMLLFSNPHDVLRLINAGFKLERLNVGGMKNNGQKKQIARAVAVTAEDVAAFRQIIDSSTEVFIQMVPNDKSISFQKAIE